ncbi:MAG: alpha-L-glutamate ligase-like protein [bacterium]|nr:alpha-L-glutamate ligase-like protein [bacterium]
MINLFQAARELRAAGVLGMNRRNADYIMAYNPRSSFPLVDDKVMTDYVATTHGVPMPPILKVIEHNSEIEGFETTLGATREFAIKPARGAGGSGIVLVRDWNEAGFIKPSGDTIPRKEAYHHISNILSGIFSLAGQPDRAIIQSLVHPDPVFEAVSYRGVPDIRIVVYRGVPAMAMTRLPTRASDGKANLHRGAIGAGISISAGVTRNAVCRGEVVAEHPDTGNPVSGVKVPYWPEMLLAAARSFDMTGMGYLGVDQVIDRDRGPVMLELNARPGLAIQVANRIGLWGRLQQVEAAPPEAFVTAEARVAWARRTFAPAA